MSVCFSDIKDVALALRGTLLGFIPLFIFSSLAYASESESVEEVIRRDVDKINNCIAASTKHSSQSASTFSETVPDLAVIELCFSTTIGDISDDIEIDLSLTNSLLTYEVEVFGTYTLALAALNDGVLDKHELTEGLIDSGSCTLSDTSRFSYIVPSRTVRKWKIYAFQTAVDSIEEEHEAMEGILTLRRILDALSDQVIESSDLLPQLGLDCTSPTMTISIEDGLADIDTVQPIESNRSSPFAYSFSSSNRNRTYTLNGQTVKIKERRRNDRTETSYQALPMQVDIEAARLLPSKAIQNTQDVQDLCSFYDNYSALCIEQTTQPLRLY